MAIPAVRCRNVATRGRARMQLPKRSGVRLALGLALLLFACLLWHGREHDPRTRAHHQRFAKLVFEALDLMADRRLRAMQPLGA